jgi:crossover junction endodeoxyribonuclease RuvC
VLGVDPGLAATGYGLIGPGPAGVTVIDTGVIETDADLPFDARIEAVYDGVQRVLAKHGPDLLVVEDLYSEYKFPRSALVVAHGRGVVFLAARQCHVRVLALAPAEVKRAITGHGAASKAQIQRGIQRLLGLGATPRPSHVADALALAVTGFSRAGGRIA